MTDSIRAIREQVIAAAALPLSQATTLPREAYVSESYFDFEARSVLAAGWQCIAHVSQLKETGSYLAIDLLDEPLVAVRGKDGAIRALSRVCPHRATDIMHEAFKVPREGVTPRLFCPYHAWTFNLDGRAFACPEMQRSEGFDKKDWRLAELRSEIWEGFVFVNLAGTAPPLAQTCADFQRRIAPWRTAEMEVVIRLEWDCAFNWKSMVENWMESYHHLGIHHQTLQPLMPANTTWTDGTHEHFVHCHLPYTAAEAARARNGEPLPGFKTIPGLTLDQQSEWGLFLGFPTFMYLTMRDRVLWYLLQPQSAGRCKLTTMTLVPKESRDDPAFQRALAAETKMLADFHMEDMRVNTAVHAGLRSSHAARGRLSYLEEPVWHIQRLLAARISAAG